jgi:hypothetical protein
MWVPIIHNWDKVEYEKGNSCFFVSGVDFVVLSFIGKQIRLFIATTYVNVADNLFTMR